MQLTKKNWISIIVFIIALVALFFMLKIFLVPYVNSQEFRSFIQEIGIGGYFILGAYIVLTQVFAPLSGTPGVILSMSIYGVGAGMLILYLGSMVSSVINFYISRKWGRKWVVKFIGEKGMKEVDEFTEIEGGKALIICRIFGFTFLEFVSYAVGLTKMPFKKYMIITLITSAITHTISYFVFKNIDFQSEWGIIIWLVFVFGVGLIFGIFLKLYLNKRKQKGEL